MPQLMLLAIYSIFLLLPWYHGASGQLQPVDFAIFASLCLLAINRCLLVPSSSVYVALMIFLLYDILRLNAGYAYTMDPAELYGLLENIYNIVLLVVFTAVLFYLLATRSLEIFYKNMLFGLLIMAILPLGVLLIYGPGYAPRTLTFDDVDIGRATLTFNNANQLGFFGLVNLSIFFYMTLLARANSIKIKMWTSLAIININFLFLFLSESRAATPAILLYAFSYPLILNIRSLKNLKYILWPFVCLLLVGFIVKQLFIYMLISRSSMMPTTQVGVMDDIYIRAIQGVEYNLNNLFFFLFGSGIDNNPLRLDHLEFHNNFTFVFNQLGFLGLLLYCYIMLIIFTGLWKKGWQYVLPFLCYLFYSNLQYALRTRMNWLFFAVIIFILLSRCKRSQLLPPKGRSL